MVREAERIPPPPPPPPENETEPLLLKKKFQERNPVSYCCACLEDPQSLEDKARTSTCLLSGNIFNSVAEILIFKFSQLQPTWEFLLCHITVSVLSPKLKSRFFFLNSNRSGPGCGNSPPSSEKRETYSVMDTQWSGILEPSGLSINSTVLLPIKEARAIGAIRS